MRIVKLKGKNIVFLLSILGVVLFISIILDKIYSLPKDKQAKELKRLPIKSDYLRIKSDCVGKAARWLSNISIDTLELNERGMKGKKHFMEKLFSFYQLYLHTTNSKKKLSGTGAQMTNGF